MDLCNHDANLVNWTNLARNFEITSHDSDWLGDMLRGLFGTNFVGSFGTKRRLLDWTIECTLRWFQIRYRFLHRHVQHDSHGDNQIYGSRKYMETFTWHANNWAHGPNFVADLNLTRSHSMGIPRRDPGVANQYEEFFSRAYAMPVGLAERIGKLALFNILFRSRC